jgi:hypothetical protein
MSRSALKYRVIQPLEKFCVNPSSQACLATRFRATATRCWRRSGDARVECGGRPFAMAEREIRSGWSSSMGDVPTTRNIEANPHVRVRTGSRAAWRTGMAYVLDDDDDDDDDPTQRLRILGQRDPWRRLCLGASKAMGTNLLTVRIDLDPL